MNSQLGQYKPYNLHTECYETYTTARIEELEKKHKELLTACNALLAWCEKNPPAGESLYCIQQIKDTVKKCEDAK